MQNKLELLKKSFTFVLGGVVLLGAVYYYANQPKSSETANTSSSQQSTPSGQRDFSELIGGDAFSYDGEEGKTALELLKAKAKVEMSGEGEMGFVNAINGRKADSAKREFWGFYVNGFPSEIGAGSYETQVTDKIEWKITTY